MFAVETDATLTKDMSESMLSIFMVQRHLSDVVSWCVGYFLHGRKYLIR